jgi:hypothetical protein
MRKIQLDPTNIHRSNHTSPVLARHSRTKESDRASAENNNLVTRLNAGLSNGMHSDRQWLNEHCFIQPK